MSLFNSKYLLDSNIFIESHNLHYHPLFCQAFWDWVNSGHEQGVFYSIDKVQKELKQSGPSGAVTDEITLRMQSGDIPASLFLPTLSSTQEINIYRSIMKWASEQSFTQKAQDEFAQETEADAFLIALAKSEKYILVTKETRADPQAKNRIMIPNVAKAFDVPCINLSTLLRKHAADNFQFKT